MTHRRQSIRKAIAAAIGGVTTRTRPTQDSELPARIVYTLKETSGLANLRRALERPASVAIELRVKATGDLDDALDAQCEAVEAAMEIDPTFGRLAINSFLASTTIGLDGEGDSAQGVATLEYQVTYRTG